MSSRLHGSKIKTSDVSNFRYYAADFETTTASIDKDRTRVWSFAVDEVGRYEPEIYPDIKSFFDFCSDPDRGKTKRIYFHNLKFDGNFILWHLRNVLHFTERLQESGEMDKPKNLESGEMVYIISDVGQWYYIAFRISGILVECRDSLKILPFSLKEIGDAFCTRYKKSEMNYDDKSSLEDCTEEDIKYIKNDVLVLSEALSFIMQTNGEESPFKPIHSLTIGGACLQEFKSMNYGDNKQILIKLDQMPAPPESEVANADRYIRLGYRGGFCYVNESIQGKEITDPGFTADVNSLYPFVMSSKMSGSRYPFGKGIFKEGKPGKADFELPYIYFYMRVRVSFVLKRDFVPTVQKKNSFLYRENAYLKSSAMMNFKTGEYIGAPRKIEMVFSKDDFILFCEHYNIIEIEYLDYIKFQCIDGLFDRYIDDFAKIKMESKGATRSLAKLFSNNLYGQMAKSTNSSFNKCISSEGEPLKFEIVDADSKTAVNIAIGAAITSKARFYQISTIQNNLSRFCYSDTDSLHCIGSPADFVGRVDDKIYGAYKIEAEWIRAKFLRQKTYIEEYPGGKWNICAAGMTPEQKEYFRNNFEFSDFEKGLTIVGGKLKPKMVEGGVILEEVDFTIR